MNYLKSCNYEYLVYAIRANSDPINFVFKAFRYLITIELILRDKTLQTLDFIIGTKLFVCQHNCFKNIESFDI
jgi:hypothetical protein